MGMKEGEVARSHGKKEDEKRRRKKGTKTEGVDKKYELILVVRAS